MTSRESRCSATFMTIYATTSSRTKSGDRKQVKQATRPAFFTSEFLAQLERLSLLSRRIFRGRVKVERRILRRGHSVEFCDYRAYGVGDDLRYVDWNIYGRLDRLHVKLFVDEEDL